MTNNTTPRRTFMEILKVHNKEVPMANLLAYLFKPNEEHKLGTTFLAALLNTTCYEIKGNREDQGTALKGACVIPAEFSNETFTPVLENIKVRTEVPTNGQDNEEKRIDILIEADNFVVCIEFKINHDLDNPLEIYQSYMKANYEGKAQYFIVIAPYRKEPIGEAEKYLKRKVDFKLVILSHFIEQVKLHLPENYSQENQSNPYAQYFFDFIQTIENRKVRTQIVKKLEEVKNELNRVVIPCDIKRKWNGGYLLIPKKGYNLKVRVTGENYQIEKWSSKSQKEKEQTNVEVSDIVRIAGLKMF
ncbi:PD-(D/E)XK nuclease family protein [Ancylomarina sp. YFZ004]